MNEFVPVHPQASTVPTGSCPVPDSSGVSRIQPAPGCRSVQLQSFAAGRFGKVQQLPKLSIRGRTLYTKTSRDLPAPRISRSWLRTRGFKIPLVIPESTPHFGSSTRTASFSSALENPMLPVYLPCNSLRLRVTPTSISYHLHYPKSLRLPYAPSMQSPSPIITDHLKSLNRSSNRFHTAVHRISRPHTIKPPPGIAGALPEPRADRGMRENPPMSTESHLIISPREPQSSSELPSMR